MSFGALDQLLSQEFELSMFFYATPSALRRQLQKSAETHEVRRALAFGLISEETFERFIEYITAHIKQKQKFRYEIALAAVVVALEDRPTKFVEAFLREFAEIKAIEIRLSAGVAR